LNGKVFFNKCAPTGWRRLIGSPKLQIIFHKRSTKYRSLLRKMTYKDKGSYESSPPCITLALKFLHPQNPLNRETQISRYLEVQIQIEILFSFESVQRNLRFWIWWIWGGVACSVESVIKSHSTRLLLYYERSHSRRFLLYRASYSFIHMKQIHIHTHTYTYVHKHMATNTHTYTHTCNNYTHIHTHMQQIHTHTHTHADTANQRPTVFQGDSPSSPLPRSMRVVRV